MRLLNVVRTGFIRMFISILLLAPLSFAACGPSPSVQPTEVLRFPWFEPPDSIDPAVAFGGYPITINLFQGTVSRENPNILLDAKSIQSSSDSRIWTFHLKENLRWSNGKPLTAADYEYGIKRFIDPKTASPLAFFSYYIKGGQAANEGKTGLDSVAVQAVDAHTLRDRI